MNQPKPESRISNLENRTTTLEAVIIELSSDTAEELKVIRQEMQSGFLEMGNAFDLNASNIDGVRTTLETRLSRIESTQEQILALLQQKAGE